MALRIFILHCYCIRFGLIPLCCADESTKDETVYEWSCHWTHTIYMYNYRRRAGMWLPWYRVGLFSAWFLALVRLLRGMFVQDRQFKIYDHKHYCDMQDANAQCLKAIWNHRRVWYVLRMNNRIVVYMYILPFHAKNLQVVGFPHSNWILRKKNSQTFGMIIIIIRLTMHNNTWNSPPIASHQSKSVHRSACWALTFQNQVLCVLLS